MGKHFKMWCNLWFLEGFHHNNRKKLASLEDHAFHYKVRNFEKEDEKYFYTSAATRNTEKMGWFSVLFLYFINVEREKAYAAVALGLRNAYIYIENWFIKHQFLSDFKIYMRNTGERREKCTRIHVKYIRDAYWKLNH